MKVLKNEETKQNTNTREILEKELQKRVHELTGLTPEAQVFIFQNTSELIQLSLSQVINAFTLLAKNRGIEISDEEINSAMGKAKEAIMSNLVNPLKNQK